ncbi:MAG: hypothetical protein AAGF35_06200 [Pseudomonadota bacterium]
MSHYPEAFDHMLAAWNETNPERVRAHLDKALAPNIRFVDPSIDVTGIVGFEANVHNVHDEFPGNVYSRVSEIDSQHGFHRYHWAIHDKHGALFLPGFDVAETDSDQLISCVVGFFGELEKVSD